MKYRILNQNKVLYENLTEEEYFEMMECLAEEFYRSNTPKPENIKTEVEP